jgi:hypothetical protein
MSQVENDGNDALATRTFAVRLLAPLAAPVAASLITSVASLVFLQPAQNDFSARALINWFLLTSAWTLAVTFVLGLPWHAFAYHRRWHRVWAYCLPGAFVGAVLPAAVLLHYGLVEELAYFIVYAGAGGGLTGLLFWLMRRPDRDANLPTSLL